LTIISWVYNFLVLLPVVFIDESGTLPDPKDKVIILAALITARPEELPKLFKGLQKKGQKSKTNEIKFYSAGEKTKVIFFERLAREKLDLFLLTVEKMGRKIPDTPRHFALLSWILLRDVLTFRPQTAEVFFDRHFAVNNDLKKFNETLSSLLQKRLVLKHVDSKKDPRINAADMAASATLAFRTGRQPRFYEMLRPKIVSDKNLNWAQVKQEFFANKKLA